MKFLFKGQYHMISNYFSGYCLLFDSLKDKDGTGLYLCQAAQGLLQGLYEIGEKMHQARSERYIFVTLRAVTKLVAVFTVEFQKIALATLVGFAIMGFIGFFVKLIHIPINNIIV